jgi:dienelactone hydrolase
MSETAPFTLATPAGPVLHGLVDLPDQEGRRPAVIICHGFKGFMEWGFFPYLAALLADRGFVAVRFNLSGSGMRPGEDRVGDLRAFRGDTHSGELADLLAVLDAVAGDAATIVPGRVDRGRVGLFGHSRGGGAAILAAARPPWRERLRALVTWAAIASVDRYTPQQKEEWRREGKLPVVNARTGQQLEMGLGLLEDLERNRAELDIAVAAGRLAAPWLIVHGEDDESVPASEAKLLADRAASPSPTPPGRDPAREPQPGRDPANPVDLLLIPGASHTFGSRHPFAGPTPHLIQALNATQTWFRRHL